MPDPLSTDDLNIRPLWRALKIFVLGKSSGETLRDQIEEAIEEHANDPAGNGDDLSPAERTMLKNLLGFGNTQASDVMVPRGDIIAFPSGDSFRSLVDQFADAGHSRLPVYRGSLDDIAGMIHIKDVYAHVAQAFDDGVSSHPFEAIDPLSLMRDVLFVPPTMRVLDLLARMRAGRTHMAVVIDEFGGVDGLVTIEDVVEQIVGDIEDEHDEEVEGVLTLDAGVFEADARIEVGELEIALNHAFIGDDIGDDVETVGGLVFMLAGRVPAVGEVVPHPSGWRFEVIDGDARKVGRVRVHAPEASIDEAAA